VGNGQFSEQVAAKEISGRLIFVIPFFGTVFGLIGL
jgi:hypothetical protein